MEQSGTSFEGGKESRAETQRRRRTIGWGPARAGYWAALAAAFAAAPARAQEEKDAEPDVLPGAAEVPDYAPVRAWNGLGRFVELARGAGIAVDVVKADEVKWEPTGTLVFVFPDRAPDGPALRDFVAAGGRVLVADDFGLGADALGPLGILRVSAPSETGSAFRGNGAFPIAVPVEPHPTLEGVGAVVTNHPAALGLGPGVRCLLAFLAPPPACLLAEVERGYGTALALADPSVLIDLMLEADGNRRLAVGLLRHLTANRRARLTLVVPEDAWAAVRPEGAEAAGTRAAIRRWLAKFSEVLAGAPPWLWLAAGVALFLWAAAGRVRTPSREDFQPPRLLHAERPEGATAYPGPGAGEAWAAFSTEAVDAMHAATTRKLEDVSARLAAERKGGGSLRRRMRLRLARSRLAGLQRRLREAGDDAAGAPGISRLRKLASDFERST
ncbi:MAG: DUF4350 domain-containing protein [Deltaproteobacteria bacterium]|nr:DUF4350 domain-containing protein [Deltaproteobacteria bacterium]